MFENPKLTFDIGSATMETNIKLSGKEIKKYTRTFFTIIIAWMVV